MSSFMPFEAMLAILLFGLLFPGLALLSRNRARDLLLSLKPSDLPSFHVHQALTLLVLGALALLPLATGEAGPAAFGLGTPDPGDAMPGLVLLSVLLLLSALGRRAIVGQSGFRRWIRRLVPEEIIAMTPKDGRSLRSWALLSLGAGIGEELMFRAALPWALSFTMAPMPAVLLASLAFAVGHLYQGRRNAAFIFLLGTGFGALVLATGSLPLAMFLHALYDFEVGRLYLALHRCGPSPDGSGVSGPA